MPRTLDEVLAGYQIDREQLLAVMPGSMTPPTMGMPSPMSMGLLPLIMGDITTSSVAQAARQGYAATRQWDMPHPLAAQQLAMVMQTPQFVGLPSPIQMTPAAMGVFRPGPSPAPPGLRSTPGVTGMFHSAADLAVQNELMLNEAFINPATAGQALAQRNVRRVGEQYGGLIGAGVGAAGGGLIGGGGGAWTGAQVGEAAGGMFGGEIAGSALGAPFRWAHEQMYGEAAQQLSMMANLQQRTMGRLSLTGPEAGLGGRGLSSEAAMALGQRLTGMGQGTGGAGGFNRQDMLNLTQGAAEQGLLDAATNIDQIASTIEKLMTVVGRMAKLTGDPNFQNNLRELGNLKRMGFTVDQAVDAVAGMGRYAREAGMTRTQAMEVAGAPGAARFAAAGLAPGLGAVAGTWAAGQARMMEGTYTPLQAALLGGREGIQQRMTESQAAFLGGTARLMVPSLLQMGEGGELTLDPTRVREMMRGGRMDIQQTMAGGMANLQNIASQSGTSARELMHEALNRMPEFQSMLGQQLGPMGTDIMQMKMIQGLRGQFGLRGAVGIAAGGDPQQTEMLFRRLRSPQYFERQQEAIREQTRQEQMMGRQEAREAQEAREGAASSRWWDKQLREYRVTTGAAVAGYQALGEWWERANVREARDELRTQAQQRAEAEGMQRVWANPAMRANQQIAREMAKRLTARGGLGGVNLETGAGMEQFELETGRLEFTGDVTRLTRAEMGVAAGMQTRGGLRGIIGDVDQWVARTTLGIDEAMEDIGTFLGRDVPQRTAEEIAPAYVRSVRDASRRVIETGKRIEETRKTKYREYVNVVRTMRSQFEGEGLGVGTLASIKTEIISYARERGQSGGMVDEEELRRRTREALVKRGMSRGRATYLVMQKNREFWGRFGMATIKFSSDEDAKTAVARTGESAQILHSRFDIEAGEEMMKRAQEKYEGFLEDAGIYQGGALKTEEIQAMEELKKAPTDVQAAMLILEGRDQAAIEELEATGGEAAVEGRKRLEKLSTRGREMMGSWAKYLQRAGVRGREGFGGALERARRFEGPLAKMFIPEAAEAAKIEYERATGKKWGEAPTPGGAGITEERRRRVEELGEEGRMLEELRKAFVEEGGPIPELVKAAKALQAVAAGKPADVEIPAMKVGFGPMSFLADLLGA